MSTLADMADMPRKSALEFLQKETTVAAILQVNIKSFDKFTIYIFYYRTSSKIKPPTSPSSRSGSTTPRAHRSG